MPKKKADALHAHAESPASSASLIICRNKHWRYISSFHGPWLQLPPEVLDSLAHQNYTMPSPRMIDPAVFYDVVKIRKAVDDAAQDSVRASTGTSMHAAVGRFDQFGATAGAATHFSKERIFKVRQKAVRSLHKAFSLDEIATSVATMQATSTIEDVAMHVLRRDPNSYEGKYVHFFHEKIPSREMEQFTTLQPLDEIITALPLEQQAPSLRTRAMVQIFKCQWQGAVEDLTMALRIVAELKLSHSPNQQQIELASKMREEQERWHRSQRDWRSIPPLKEEDQPSGLEQQLLFHRAGAFLTMACESVHGALDGLPEYLAAHETGALTDELSRTQAARLEARKAVKLNAKRALKDYLDFLSHFDYTPGLPSEVTSEIARRMAEMASSDHKHSAAPVTKQSRVKSSSEHPTNGSGPERRAEVGAVVKHERVRSSLSERDMGPWPPFPQPHIYPASALFAEKPLPSLPAFPPPEGSEPSGHMMREALGEREVVTYHPLLTDALHALLLAHALLQTSPTELQRHANNVARLARIADGYPLFQAARSPARADWIEVLRRANNWVNLAMPWQQLSTPAPLPEGTVGRADTGSSLTVTHQRGRVEETPEQKHERIKQESILDALSDDRVVDEESFRRAVRARERRAVEDEQGTPDLATDHDATCASAAPRANTKCLTSGARVERETPQFAQQDRTKHCSISSERAATISRWIREAPLTMGPRKKRPLRKKRPVVANGVIDGLGQLSLDGEIGNDEGPD